MHYGTCMGVFWMVKFVFFPLGLANPLLLFVFFALTVAVPFMGFRFAKSVRDKVYYGVMSFMRAWVFLIFMYMFAALLTAVVHYVYFRFIDNGYIMDTYAAIIDTSSDADMPGLKNYLEQMKQTIEIIQSMTAIQITMQLFTQNILYCSFIALITAPFVVKKKQIISKP